MISDRDWESARRSVGYVPRARRNPQIQVLGSWPHRSNPGPYRGEMCRQVDHYDADRRNERGSIPRDVKKAVTAFHGGSEDNVIISYDTDNGGGSYDLAYLGDVPGISWLSEDDRSRPIEVTVEEDLVEFEGFRKHFRSEAPILCLDTKRDMAVIVPSVPGSLDSVLKLMDSNGVLGIAPIVEYIVKRKPESTKNTNQDGSRAKDVHYVHEFEKDQEPVLVYDPVLEGLVYERKRSLAGERGRAIYKVELNPRHGDGQSWFFK